MLWGAGRWGREGAVQGGGSFPCLCPGEGGECPGGFNPGDQKLDFLAGLSLTPGDLWTHSCSSRAFLVWAAGGWGA